MISLILYGRNDNYGYNLHKRAAISLNCMAELLDDPDDEILFVDYNTPDDMPTFVEAIFDTLTDRARRILRVLRVRPSVHERWRGKTHLNALESPARNIALRRSNPNNRWILSTNTDMVFVMRDGSKSLSAAVRDLPRGYYGIPRFEMPESLWESLDRKDPQAVIGAFARWGQTLHLDEVVHSYKSILFDGPGDFQLVPRDDLFKIHGFSEAMLLGWHVDSNLAKRCLLLYGATNSLFDKVAGYHCDHTKVVTPAHGPDRVQNDMVEHISNVQSPYLPQQADSWGAPDAAVEEILVPPGRDIGFADALAPILGPMPSPLYESTYTQKTWNQFTYPARHVIPYLADQIATYPRDIDLAYAGINDTTRALLAETWRALGFTGRLLVHRDTAGVKPGCETAPESDAPFVVADLDYLIDHAALFILDLGVEDGPAWPNKIFNLRDNPKAKGLLPLLKSLQAAAQEIAAAERLRIAARRPPRRVIFVNTINGEFAGRADAVIGQTITPFCTRVRHGTLKPEAADQIARQRADAERSGAAAAKAIMDAAARPLPFELLDWIGPDRLLTAQQRDQILAGIAKRSFPQPWGDLARLSLTTLSGDFDRQLAAYLATPPGDAAAFIERMTLLRVAAAELMSRPWPKPAADAIATACARFLEGWPALPEDFRAQSVTTMLLLFAGAAGRSLDAALDHVVTACGKQLARPPEARALSDAWTALCVADVALARPAWIADASRAASVRDKLVVPALRLIAAPAPARQGSDVVARIAIVAAAPFLHAIDSGAQRLAEALGHARAIAAPPPKLRVFPLQAPDAAFVARASQQGIEVAEAPEPNGTGASHAAQRLEALRDQIRAWSPDRVLAVGDSVRGLALLALGLAPRQGAYGNRFAGDELPGVGCALADTARLEHWLRPGKSPASPQGGSVGVAAR